MRVANANTGAFSLYARSLKLHNLHVVAQSLELARKDKTQARLREVRERKRGFPPGMEPAEEALGMEMLDGSAVSSSPTARMQGNLASKTIVSQDS